MLYVTAKRKKKEANRLELEKLYCLFSSDNTCEPNELGRCQFFESETFGKFPKNPDPYYLKLSQGKKWFSVQQEMIRDSYGTWDWWGFYSYWLDWKGNRWVLEYLMSWHPEPPEWLTREDLLEPY